MLLVALAIIGTRQTALVSMPRLGLPFKLESGEMTLGVASSPERGIVAVTITGGDGSVDLAVLDRKSGIVLRREHDLGPRAVALQPPKFLRGGSLLQVGCAREGGRRTQIIDLRTFKDLRLLRNSADTVLDGSASVDFGRDGVLRRHGPGGSVRDILKLKMEAAENSIWAGSVVLSPSGRLAVVGLGSVSETSEIRAVVDVVQPKVVARFASVWPTGGFAFDGEDLIVSGWQPVGSVAASVLEQTTSRYRLTQGSLTRVGSIPFRWDAFPLAGGNPRVSPTGEVLLNDMVVLPEEGQTPGTKIARISTTRAEAPVRELDISDCSGSTWEANGTLLFLDDQGQLFVLPPGAKKGRPITSGYALPAPSIVATTETEYLASLTTTLDGRLWQLREVTNSTVQTPHSGVSQVFPDAQPNRFWFLRHDGTFGLWQSKTEFKLPFGPTYPSFTTAQFLGNPDVPPPGTMALSPDRKWLAGVTNVKGTGWTAWALDLSSGHSVTLPVETRGFEIAYTFGAWHPDSSRWLIHRLEAAKVTSIELSVGQTGGISTSLLASRMRYKANGEMVPCDPKVGVPVTESVLTGSFPFVHPATLTDWIQPASLGLALDGQANASIDGIGEPVNALAGVPWDPNLFLCSTGQGVSYLVDAQVKAVIAKVLFVGERDWIVVGADGRFDLSSFDRLGRYGWVFPERLELIPFELLARQYYEPRLLWKLMRREELPKLPAFASNALDRPTVVVRSARFEAGKVGVDVYVDPSDALTRKPSDPVDLKVFADGRLIGWVDGELGRAPRTFKFPGIGLPQRGRPVRISAYAFGSGGVRSAESLREVQDPRVKSVKKPKAVIVAVGIDEYSDPAFRNLRFASSDARLASGALAKRLLATGRFELIKRIDLEGRKATTSSAVRSAIRQLATLGPDDAVIVWWAGHGYVHTQKGFQLVPSDGVFQNASNCLSVRDLEALLRPVRARMCVVLDTCQSGGATGADFKPAPLASRGFGQLAYDKKMLLVAAAQSDQYAMESDRVKAGVLTWAFAAEALPKHATGSLGDVAVTAAELVPLVIKSIEAGGPVGSTRAAAAVQGTHRPPRASRPVVQLPVVFDFCTPDTRIELAPAGK